MTTYYDLVIQCPACIAQNGYDPQPPHQWYHANCGGKIQIGDDAFYKCLVCGHSSHIKNWRYACSFYPYFTINDRPTTAPHFSNAISLSVNLLSFVGRQWLLTFMQNLGDW